MWLRVVLLLFFVYLIPIDTAFSQDPKPEAEDSNDIYRDIESFSKRGRFTEFMFGLFFKPVEDGPGPKAVIKRLPQEPYIAFEGKPIRNIHIQTLDPFGNSIGDTITASLNFLSRAGNKLHVKTHSTTIRNLLLVNEGQLFDSLLVKESERLVRSREYITDVAFFIEQNADSVDIYIRVLDNWSIIPGGSLSNTRLKASLRETNFVGLGHQFNNELVWNHSTGDHAFQTLYHIPNIRNSFINSTLQYGTDEYGNFVRSIAVDRPFFSPFARWAAGADISQHMQRDSVWSGNLMHYRYNAQDFWGGYSVRVLKGNTEFSRTTNFITTARFLRKRFRETPDENLDTLRFYTDENLYLASVGFSSRQFVRDNFIFKFGITEDVPVGRVLSLTAGLQDKNNMLRPYFGGRLSSGKYYPWGYMSINLEYGTFIGEEQAEQGAVDASMHYFTNLIEIGKWKFRQFVKPQFTIGINRTDYDTLTINNEYGLMGFYSPALSGNSRLLFTSQTQSYAPWDFIGFHFGPYFIFSLGMLGDKDTGFRSSKLYSQFGLGVLIKNDNLVMNTFQVSISFFPVIPAKGNNIFRFNSFQTADFGFSNFEIGKPGTVVFR